MELISFNTAKLAQELYFKEPCLHYFSLDSDPKSFSEDGMYYYSIGAYGRLVLSPYQSQLQNWLRERDIIITICPFSERKLYHNLEQFDAEDEGSWCYFIHNQKEFENGGAEYKTYEQALEQGLIEGLKILKDI